MSVALLTFHEPAWVYISLPLGAAIVGYLTKLVAIEMLFRPLEFRGPVDPWIGWQGQIPRRAGKMAAIAVETLTEELLRPDELFQRIDVDELLAEIEVPLRKSLELLTEELVDQYRPGLWDALPDTARRHLVSRVQKQAPAAVQRLLDEIRADIDRVFDIKHMVVTNLVRDKALLNRMFREVAAPEFRFMTRAGLAFGFAIGLVQTVTLLATGSHLVLPIFGLITGGLTDYLALQMIFRPMYPGRYLGVLPWHGMFHKRREQVATDYAALIAQEILTPRAILASLMDGPMSDRLFELVQREVKRTIDDQAGLTRPFVVAAVGGRKYRQLKRSAADRVIELMPETARHAESYAERALDLGSLIAERMREMSPEQYEDLLRPAVKDDEWVVVAVGAALGFLVGELQVQLLLA